MKKNEIQIGGLYHAKVSGKITTVRVDNITEETRYAGRNGTYYHVTNTATARKITFRSATKFRSVAKLAVPKVGA